MTALLQSLGRTVALGFVLLIALVLGAGLLTGSTIRLDDFGWWRFAFRWVHVMVAVMWVGLLYYFNFVQVPSMARIPDEQKPAVTRVIAPAALFWFRWSALATVASGLILAMVAGYLLPALMLQPGVHAIGIGMWLGLVMAFNVWFVIWPNQKVALGLVDAAPERRARAARIAMLVSRVNVALSVPMLYCMVAQQNGGL